MQSWEFPPQITVPICGSIFSKAMQNSSQLPGSPLPMRQVLQEANPDRNPHKQHHFGKQAQAIPPSKAVSQVAHHSSSSRCACAPIRLLKQLLLPIRFMLQANIFPAAFPSGKPCQESPATSSSLPLSQQHTHRAAPYLHPTAAANLFLKILCPTCAASNCDSTSIRATTTPMISQFIFAPTCGDLL